MYATIRDPNIAKGFSVLANVLGRPSAETAIKADMLRAQREKIAAETAYQQQQLRDLVNAAARRRQLADVLADPNWMNTPEGRAAAAGHLPYIEDGLQYGPGFLTGTSVFTRPEHLDPHALSNVLIGTGVVNSWGDTPVGHKYEVDTEAATDLATGGGSKTPLDISPTDMANLQFLAEERLKALYPDAASFDPDVMARLMPLAAQVYQRTRNAEIAVQQALQGVPLEQYTYDTWMPFDEEQRVRAAQPFTPPAGTAPAAPADNPAAGGAPAPAAGQTYPDGTIGYTKDGRRVQKVNGVWVPLK